MFFSFREIRSFQRDGAGLYGDCACGTGGYAASALYAFPVAYVPHIHFAVRDAFSAVDALFIVYPYADYGKAVEKRIDGAQGTKEAAEHAIDPYGKKKKENENQELRRKERGEHGKLVVVGRVNKKTGCALQGSGGADVFAQCRKRYTGRNAGQRKQNDKNQ